MFGSCQMPSAKTPKRAPVDVNFTAEEMERGWEKSEDEEEMKEVMSRKKKKEVMGMKRVLGWCYECVAGGLRAAVAEG